MDGEEKSAGQQTVEAFQRNQQTAMLAGAHMQFVSCITMQPPPSKMPIEVRTMMRKQLEKTLQLFAPTPEETALEG
jgi:hypothetical protein